MEIFAYTPSAIKPLMLRQSSVALVERSVYTRGLSILLAWNVTGIRNMTSSLAASWQVRKKHRTVASEIQSSTCILALPPLSCVAVGNFPNHL